MATDDLVLQTRQLSADQALAWAQMCADNANRPDYAIPTLSPVSVEPATLRYAYDLRAPGAASTERSVAFTDPRTHVVYGCVGRSDLTTASAVSLYGPAATFARLKSCVYPPDTRYPITPNDESYQLNGMSGQSTERVRASGWFRVGPEVARVRQRVTMPGQVPGAWVSSVAGPDLVYVEAWGTEALETGGTSATEPGSVEIQAFDADGNLLTPPPDQRDGCVLSPAAGTSARHSFNPHGG
jgi:hypothetical protein